MLFLKDISLHVSGKLLFNDANLRINPGTRMGVVGRNGTGKTHLMELLAGNIGPDAGKREVNSGVTVLLVKQDLPEDNQSPLEYVRNNDPDIQEAEEALEVATNSTLADASNRLTELDEERYEKLAPKVLMGLGLTKAELDQPMRNLSGGMRMRIGLAMALIRTPDVLLLDEPTNHLDLEASQWLISYLKNYPLQCALVVVSHDLAVLKQVTTSIAHLRGGVLTEFAGDYHLYREQLALREGRDIQRNKALESQIEQHTMIYHKFKALPESRAAQAVAQLKKAEQKKKEIVEIVTEEPVVQLSFGKPVITHDVAINIKQVTLGYADKNVLTNVNLSVQHGSKIGLLGRNGEGKSTLIKLLVEKLAPKRGQVDRGSNLKIGYFSQDLADELQPGLSVYKTFATKTGIDKESVVRSMLAKYGFSHDKIGTLVGNLSGGEKSRLLFCLICTNSPNLIIMDEPTNHLDVETREELAKAMNDFTGSVILVSHDADLHEETMQNFWLVKDGSVKVYDKSLKHYQAELLQATNAAEKKPAAPTKKATNAPSPTFYKEAPKGKATSSSSSSAKKADKPSVEKSKLAPQRFYQEDQKNNAASKKSTQASKKGASTGGKSFK